MSAANGGKCGRRAAGRHPHPVRHGRAACKAAGIEPRFREFEGGDPVAYVVSAYLRRHGLLLPGEARRLTTADFQPEAIEIAGEDDAP